MRIKRCIKIKHDKIIEHACFDVQINMYRNFANFQLKKDRTSKQTFQSNCKKREGRDFKFV